MGAESSQPQRPASGRPAAKAVHQPAHEGFAEGNLFDLDIFVGLMGLGNIAGAADDGRYARFLKQPGFGAEGDLADRVGAGQRFDEGYYLAVDRRIETRE